MTNKEFNCWLNGFFMLENDVRLSPKQLLVITYHLNLTKAVEGYLTKENLQISDYLINNHHTTDELDEITQRLKQIIDDIPLF